MLVRRACWPDFLGNMTKISIRPAANLVDIQKILASIKPSGIPSIITGFTYIFPPVFTFRCSHINGTYPIVLTANFQSADCDYELGPYLR